MTTDPRDPASGKAKLPVLTCSRDHVAKLIDAMIQEASSVLERMPSGDRAAYDEVERKFRDWYLYCRDQLRSCFDSDDVANEFVWATQLRSIPMNPSVEQLV